EGRPTVAMVASLTPAKGHLDVLDAVESLRRSIPDLLVLFAGEGPMRPVLESQLAQRGLRETVLLLGHRADVPALLKRSTVALRRGAEAGRLTLTAEGDRAISRLPFRGISSAGRAPQWHCGGRRFDPAMLHQEKPCKSE